LAAFQKFNAFINELSLGGHDLQTAVFKAALTDTAPVPASDTVWSAAVYPPPAAAGLHLIRAPFVMPPPGRLEFGTRTFIPGRW
jgi:hypothetical protein